MSSGEDQFGKYLSCLQCGLLLDVPKESATEEHEPVPQVEERKAA